MIKDALDVSREILFIQYSEAAKNGNEARRIEIVKELTKLHQLKMARLVQEARRDRIEL